jgi:precorrin isomerase
VTTGSVIIIIISTAIISTLVEISAAAQIVGLLIVGVVVGVVTLRESKSWLSITIVVHMVNNRWTVWSLRMMAKG